MRSKRVRDTGPVRAGDWLRFARHWLVNLPGQRGEQFLDEADLDVQLLLAQVLGQTRSWVIAHQEQVLTPRQQSQLTRLLARLSNGEPLPYLLGHWEFYGLDFIVTPAVLVPRPETELLVEQALEWLRAHPGRRHAADVGTGSGCISVSLARHIGDIDLLAVDLSREALEVARSNAAWQDVAGQIRFVQGNLLAAARGPLDLVCANLPYIPNGVLATLAVARHEPHAALDGGPDGLSAIRALLDDAPRWLAPGSLLLLEMQYDQGPAIQAIAAERLPDAQVSTLNDLAGLPRLVRIEAAGW